MNFSEGVLALCTGAGCSGIGTYLVARDVWERARSNGDHVDVHIMALRVLHMPRSDALNPQQPMPVPSLFELEMRKLLMTGWNTAVWDVYSAIRQLL